MKMTKPKIDRKMKGQKNERTRKRNEWLTEMEQVTELLILLSDE